MKFHRLLILVSFSGFLAACGGGGSGCKAGLGAVLDCDKSTSVANTAPVANAGGSQNVLTGALVALNGSASLDAQNDPLSYSWSFDSVPVGSKAVLVSAATAQPNFVADVDGVYALRLVVRDSKLSSNPALVVVTASAKNDAPVASAGANQSVLKGAVITLDGTASSDPNRNILDFTWALVARPGGSSAVLSSLTAIKPTFVADAAGTYVASLRVSDGRELSPVVYTTVVVSEVNAAPVAVTSANQNVVTGTSVTMDGTGSTDANRDSLTYNWVLTTKPNGSAASLSLATSPKPTFVADVAGLYVASLKVSDGLLSSDNIAMTTVTASAANSAPVAVVSANQNVQTGALVTLDGTGSTDANRDPLTYNWVLTAKPAGSAAVLSGATAPKPTFTADLPGTYVASLVVSDGSLTSALAVGSVTASISNAAPVAVVSANQNVQTGALVTLDGSGSTDANRDPLTYNWVLTTKPNGSAASLSSAASPKPFFVADVAGLYVASLKVSDGLLSSDNIAITTVTASVANSAPVAVISANQNVLTGALVTLDGSGSTDANRDPLNYNWVLTSKPAGSIASLNVNNSPKPSFTADLPGTYVASLVVSDGSLSSAVAVGSVTASTVNSAPVAVAGPNQSVKLNTLVTLEGRLSYDPNRDNLSYSWVLLSKPTGSTAALLPVQGSATPTFTADLAGTYVASLVVSDGQLFSGVVATTVLASAANLPPVAHAGVAQTVKRTSTVTLDGSGSTDADGNLLTYAWQIAYQPLGSSVTLSSLTDPKPTFLPVVAGVYVFNLVVNDGLANSAQATVTVTVVP
jgi:hypothetical protein